MKINPISNPNIVRSYQANKPAVPQKYKAASGLDEVSFSEEALGFSKAMAEARDKIELRTTEERARISEITEAVRQGRYNIDSGKVADKIFESVFHS